jgi:hypothetical protein
MVKLLAYVRQLNLLYESTRIASLKTLTSAYIGKLKLMYRFWIALMIFMPMTLLLRTIYFFDMVSFVPLVLLVGHEFVDLIVIVQFMHSLSRHRKTMVII